MNKNDFTKRLGQIYSVAIQKGLSEEELLLYTERMFSFLYLTEGSKQKVRCDNVYDTGTISDNRIQ